MSEASNGNGLGALAKALAKAQSEMASATKGKVNPHFGSKYADLASVWDACREALTSNGLAVTQLTANDANGVAVTTILLHESGQQLSSDCWLPVVQKTPQGYGSALTYARRYGLAAMVGVVADEDDDGNAASQAPPSAGKRTAEPKAARVVRDLRKDAPANPEGVEEALMPFGEKKGTPIREIEDSRLTGALDWLRQKLEAKPEDMRLLGYAATLEAELERRGEGA